jgi:ribonuclease J
LKSGDTGIFLDFGMNFGETAKYFEDFLNPRAARGLTDYLALELIPDVGGLYRNDLTPSDSVWNPSKTIKVDGLFISHAHVDHTGYIGLLRTDIPVHCSLMSAVLLKAMQDTGMSKIENEVAYWGPKEPSPKDERAIGSARKESYRSREFAILDKNPIPDEAQLFWKKCFSTSKGFTCEPMRTATGSLGNIKYESMPVDHSIYGATGYVFYFEDKTLAFTGDLRLHGLRKHLTEAYLGRLAEVQPDYLLIEGTNVGQAKGNDTETGARASEEDAYTNCLKAVREAEGELVVADFGPRNIDRLLIFLRIAGETGRRLIITPKDAYLLYAMRTADPSIPDVLSSPDLRIYDAPKPGPKIWERDFIMKDYAERRRKPTEISGSLGHYILAFSFFDLTQMIDIDMPGGAYIYSTCEAFNEDMMADVWRLNNWLNKLKMRPVGFHIEADECNAESAEIKFDKGYHASGHLSKDEIAGIIERVKPGAVIPIHTEHPEDFQDLISGDTRLIIPKTGQMIEL